MREVWHAKTNMCDAQVKTTERNEYRPLFPPFSEVEEPGFQAFLGAGRRLDGKAAKPIAASPASPATLPAATLSGAKGAPGSARSASVGTGSGTAAAGPSSAGGGGRTAGKLVFGSGSAGASGRGPGAAPTLQGASAANGLPKVRETRLYLLPFFCDVSGEGRGENVLLCSPPHNL